jgi:hypothetical protein
VNPETNNNTQTAPAANGATAPAMEAKELATRAPLEFELANVDDAWRMAGMLSKSGLIPDALVGKPHDVLVTLLVGRELGLSPMQSLRLIYVVKGRPYISSQLKIARVKQSEECVYFRCVETTNEKATFETERRGEGKTTLTFTAEEARAAQLLGRQTRSGEPDNWMKYTALMLRWRAASQLCDMVYPDVVGGIGTHDELEDMRRSEQAERVYAPTIPFQGSTVTPSGTKVPDGKPIPPERVVGSSSTPAATKASEVFPKQALEQAAAPAAAAREPGADEDEDPQTSAPAAESQGPTPAELELEQMLAKATKPGEILPAVGKINALPEALRAKWTKRYSDRRAELARG